MCSISLLITIAINSRTESSHIIGLGDVLELLCCLIFVVGVFVGMPLHCQHPVGCNSSDVGQYESGSLLLD